MVFYGNFTRHLPTNAYDDDIPVRSPHSLLKSHGVVSLRSSDFSADLNAKIKSRISFPASVVFAKRDQGAGTPPKYLAQKAKRRRR